EGNSGTTAYTFHVTLSSASSTPVTVAYQTADGTATTADGDYQAASGARNSAVEGTSKTIAVSVNSETKFEANETIQVQLATATGATLAVSQGTGRITNDEARPALSIDSQTHPEGNGGTTAYTFHVTLSSASNSAVTVAYHTANGTATVADGDYQAAS